jgi:mono/diheme cytochrome c family protein
MAFGLRHLVAVGVLAPLAAAGCTDRVELGRRLYADHGCAVCHGPTGRGNGPAARTLTPPPPDFANAARDTQGPSEEAIARSIRNGAGTMPAFRDISADDARLLAAWIASLQKSRESPGAGG